MTKHSSNFVDITEDAFSNTTHNNRSAANGVETLISNLETERTQLMTVLSETQQKLSQLETQNQSLESSQSQLDQYRQDLESKLQTAQTYIRKLLQEKDAIDKLRNDLEKQWEKDFEELEEARMRAKLLEKDLRDLQDEKNSLEERFASQGHEQSNQNNYDFQQYQSAIDQLRNELDYKTSQMEQQQDTITRMESEISELRNVISGMDADKQALATKLDEYAADLQRALTDCASFQSENESLKHTNEQLQSERQSLLDQISEINSRLGSLESSSSATGRNEEQESLLASQRELIERLYLDATQYQEALQGQAQLIESLRREKDELDQSLNETIQSLNDEIVTLRANADAALNTAHLSSDEATAALRDAYERERESAATLAQQLEQTQMDAHSKMTVMDQSFRTELEKLVVLNRGLHENVQVANAMLEQISMERDELKKQLDALSNTGQFSNEETPFATLASENDPASGKSKEEVEAEMFFARSFGGSASSLPNVPSGDSSNQSSAKVAQLESELAELQTALAEKDSVIAKLSATNSELETETSDLHVELENNVQALRQLQTLNDKVTQELDSHRSAAEHAGQDRELLVDSLRDLNEQNADLKQSLAASEEEKRTLEQRVQDMETEVSRLREQSVNGEDMSMQVQTLESEKAQLVQNCSSLESRIDELTREIIEKGQATSALTSSLETATAEREESDRNKQILSQQLLELTETVESLSFERNELSSKLTSLESQFQDTINERDEFAVQVSTMQQVLSESQGNQQELHDRIVGLEATKHELEELLKERVDTDSVELATLRQQNEALLSEKHAMVQQRESLESDIRQHQSSIAELETALASLRQENEYNMAKLMEKEGAITDLNLRRTNSDILHNELDSKVSQLQADLERSQSEKSAVETELNDVKSHLTALMTELENLQTALSEKEAVLGKSQADLEERAQVFENEKEEWVSSLREYEQRVKQLNNLVDEKQTILSQSTREMDSAVEENKSLNQRVLELQSNLDETNEKLQRLAEEKDTNLSSWMDEARAKESEYQATIQELRDSLSQLNERLQQVNAGAQQLRDTLGTQLSELESQRDQLEIQLRELQATNAELELQLNTSCEVRDDFAKQLTNAKQEYQLTITRMEEDAQTNAQEYQRLAQQYAELQKRLEESEVDDEGLRGRCAELEQSMSILQDQLETLGAENEDLRRVVADSETKAKEATAETDVIKGQLLEQSMSLRKARSELEEKLAEFTKEKEAFTLQITELKTENEELSQSILEAADVRERMQVALKDMQSLYTISQTQYEELNAMKKELEDKVKEMETMTNSASEKDSEIERLKEEVDKRQTEVLEVSHQLAEERERVTALNDELSDVKSKVEEKNMVESQEVETLRGQLVSMVEEKETLIAQINDMAAAEKNLQSQIIAVREQNDEIMQQFNMFVEGKAKSYVEDLTMEKETLKKSLDLAQQRIRKFIAEKDELVRQLDSIRGAGGLDVHGMKSSLSQIRFDLEKDLREFELEEKLGDAILTGNEDELAIRVPAILQEKDQLISELRNAIKVVDSERCAKVEEVQQLQSMLDTRSKELESLKQRSAVPPKPTTAQQQQQQQQVFSSKHSLSEETSRDSTLYEPSSVGENRHNANADFTKSPPRAFAEQRPVIDGKVVSALKTENEKLREEVEEKILFVDRLKLMHDSKVTELERKLKELETVTDTAVKSMEFYRDELDKKSKALGQLEAENDSKNEMIQAQATADLATDNDEEDTLAKSKEVIDKIDKLVEVVKKKRDSVPSERKVSGLQFDASTGELSVESVRAAYQNLTGLEQQVADIMSSLESQAEGSAPNVTEPLKKLVDDIASFRTWIGRGSDESELDQEYEATAVNNATPEYVNMDFIVNQFENARLLLEDHIREIEVLKKVVESVSDASQFEFTGTNENAAAAIRLLKSQVDELRKVWSHELSANQILRALVAKSQQESATMIKEFRSQMAALNDELQMTADSLSASKNDLAAYKAKLREKERALQDADQKYETRLKEQMIQHHQAARTLEDMHKKEVESLKRKIGSGDEERPRLVSELNRLRSAMEDKTNENIALVHDLRAKLKASEGEVNKCRQQIFDLQQSQPVLRMSMVDDSAIKESEWALEREKLLFELEQSRAKYSELAIAKGKDNGHIVKELELEKQSLMDELNNAKKDFSERLGEMKSRFEQMAISLRKEKQELQSRFIQAERSWVEEKQSLASEIKSLKDKIVQTSNQSRAGADEAVAQLRHQLQRAESRNAKLEQELASGSIDKVELQERIHRLESRILELDNEIGRLDHERRELINLHIEKETVWTQERRQLMDEVIDLKERRGSLSGQYLQGDIMKLLKEQKDVS